MKTFSVSYIYKVTLYSVARISATKKIFNLDYVTLTLFLIRLETNQNNLKLFARENCAAAAMKVATVFPTLSHCI